MPHTTQDAPVWSIPAQDAALGLGSTPRGLTTAGASDALHRLGPNSLSAEREPSQWRLLGKQFLSPIVLI